MIPARFGVLSNLTSLELSDSKASTTAPADMKIPDAICNLTRLRTLRLGPARLDSVLPSCFGNLSSLRVLDLSFSSSLPNMTSSLLPSSFWNLRRLRSLRIRAGRFLGFETVPIADSFPDLEDIYLLNAVAIADWTNIFLTSLKLKSIFFQGGANTFSNGALRHLAGLRTLSVTSTRSRWKLEPDFWLAHPLLTGLAIENEPLVTGSIGHEIGQSRYLRNLKIYDTPISGTIPSSIVNCPLNRLTFERTQLSHPLPSNLGHLNETLTSLSISHLIGTPTSLPDSVGVLTLLRTLRLPFNGFSGTFPSGLETSQLRSFTVNNNNFVGPLPPLSGFSWIDYAANGNHFTGGIPRALLSAANLNLNHNDLDGELDADFFTSSNFLTLSLSNNHFSGCLPPMSELMVISIDLSYNNFTCDIPSNYNYVRNLRLANNKLTGNLSSIFESSQFLLETLNLDNNKLSGTLPDLSNSAWPLKFLSLANNDLTGKIPSIGPQMSTLILSGNQFSAIWTDLGIIGKLKMLDISRNFMTANVSVFGLINPDMTYFSGADNHFTSPFDELSTMVANSLTVLDLTRTGQSGLFPAERFPALSVLKLAQNNWSGDLILSRVVQTLSQLDISRNKFSFDVSSLSSFPLLANIDAHENLIYGSVVLFELPSLQTINLANNSLNFALDLDSIAGLFSHSALKLLNISGNPGIPIIRDFSKSSSGLERTSSSAPANNFPDSVVCYDLSFFNKSSGSLIYDENLFNFEQCDCNQDHFGLPPTKCLKCPSDGTSSCGTTQATISNNSYVFSYNKTSTDPSSTPQSSHQTVLSFMWTSLVDSFVLYTRDGSDGVSGIAFGTLGLETESCLVTTIQTLSSSSNCQGVRISSSDLVSHNVSIANLLDPQCADGSDGRLCSRCLCDVGTGGSCWFPRGPRCSKCRHVFSLSTSLPLTMGLVLIVIAVGSVVLGIVLHRRRRQSLVPFADLSLPKRIFYRIMHLTTLGNLSIVVTFLQMLIGITQWDAYARVEIFGVLNGGGEGYERFNASSLE